MADFSFLHISDLHLSDHTGEERLRLSRWAPEVVEELARLIVTDWSHFVDAILISGDLADTGSKEDMGRAREFLDSSPGAYSWLNKSGHPTISKVVKPLVLLPGNHDRYQDLPFDIHAAVLAHPGGTEFDEQLSNHWPAGLAGVHRKIITKGAKSITFLCADFCLTERSNYLFGGTWGQGKVHKETLDLLEAKTGEERAKGHAVMWVSHFAPCFPDLSENLQLVDGLNLVRLAESMTPPVKHIFTGHTHEARYPYFPAGPKVRVHCAGSATCLCNRLDERPIAHFVEVDVESGDIANMRVAELLWSENDQTFIEP